MHYVISYIAFTTDIVAIYRMDWKPQQSGESGNHFETTLVAAADKVETCHHPLQVLNVYRKWGKICWAKILYFSRFSGVSRKFFHEYKCLSLIVVYNEHLWATQKYFLENFDGTENVNI